MKRSFRNKFKGITFVRPLYKNVRPKTTVLHLDRVYKLDGHDFRVRRNFVSHNLRTDDIRFHDAHLPGECDSKVKEHKNYIGNKEMIDNEFGSENVDGSKVNKKIQVKQLTVLHSIPVTWLRVFPLPKLANESWCSVLFRCLVCQIGLVTFLTVWTVIWVFVIHYFEGPNEINVSEEFKDDQSRLVIDLATELRQITPISPKWKEAIEKRIQETRLLTIQAIDKGARAHVGHFWDLPGTFLFAVYVMTALGFGAPVPQTIWGRSCALIYAILAIPMHIYLMVNSSTCIVRNVSERCSLKKQTNSRSIIEEGMPKDNSTVSPNCSRNSDMIKSSNYETFRKQFIKSVSVFCACRCVPLATVLYYACGAIVFGVMRNKPPSDVILFPIEFTTSGGLEHIKGHVRLLYGFYVEGAMVLIACILATLRQHSNDMINFIADKYRLFVIHT